MLSKSDVCSQLITTKHVKLGILSTSPSKCPVQLICPNIAIKHLFRCLHAFLTIESVLGLASLDLIQSEACGLAHVKVGQAFCWLLGVCVLHPVCSKGRLQEYNRRDVDELESYAEKYWKSNFKAFYRKLMNPLVIYKKIIEWKRGYAPTLFKSVW